MNNWKCFAKYPSGRNTLRRLLKVDALRTVMSAAFVLTLIRPGLASEDQSKVSMLREIDVWAAAIAFSPDSKRLAFADEDNNLVILDVPGFNWVRVLEGHSVTVTGISFSPAGRLMASAGWTKTRHGNPPEDLEAILWDRDSGKPIQSVSRAEHRQHSDGTTKAFVAFSPDGKLVALPSKDLHVSVREVASWREQQRLYLGNVPSAAAFSPDGKLLATSGRSGKTSIWRISK